MRWLRRLAILLVALTATSGALTFANPDPPQAKANVLCDVGGSAVSGALGIGNPAGDTCNAIADPVLGVAGHVLDPLKDALADRGRRFFERIEDVARDDGPLSVQPHILLHLWGGSYVAASHRPSRLAERRALNVGP